MKKKIINGLLFAVAMVAATSSFVSCKDYNGDNYAELQEKYLTMQAAFDKQVDAMKAYVLQSQYDSEVGDNYPTAKGTIKDRLDVLETYKNELKNDSFPKYAELIHQNNIAIATARGIADEALNRSKNDSIYLRSLLVGWDTGGELGDMVAEAAGLLTHMKNNKDAYDKAVENAQAAYDFIKDSKFNNIKELETAYDGAVAKLNTRIDSLRDVVNELKEVMRAEVTGIEIQATYNPIFGTFSYPIGVQSNILAAYYGEFEKKVYFPAGDLDDGVWANETAAILNSELQEIGAPEEEFGPGIVMVEGPGNAGKLYLTVNPSNVIMDGKEFTLRASDNSVSKVALSPLETCTEQLKWGYNRAASANGFYVATAEIKKEEANDVALSFNLKGMATEIQNIMSDWSKTSASDIAKLALTIHDGMKTNVPRLGVQAQWKDELGWKNYVSKYDVAAFSVKPLGFDFLYKMDFSGGIVKFQNKLTAKEKAIAQELINEIVKALQFELKLPATTSTNVVITADGKVKIILPEGTIYDGSEVLIAAGAVAKPDPADPTTWVPAADIKLPKTPKDGGYSIDITALIQSMGTAINNQLSKVSDTATGTINKYLDKIINLENKIFGKVESVAKNPNRYIQPALIGKCNQFKGYFYPSRNYLAPTQIEKGTKIMFYPTTLTGEIVAPAFKKYVAISGVWKVSDISSTDDAKAANDAANAAAGKKYLNTVFDGAEFNIQNGFEINTGVLKAGYVYEFIYECLGYNGKVAGKKYYIEVYE